VTLVKK